MAENTSTISWLRHLADSLEESAHFPYGPEVAYDQRAQVDDSLRRLCGGDEAAGKALGKLIRAEFGYMPHAAAIALVRASRTENIVPDVEYDESTL